MGLALIGLLVPLLLGIRMPGEPIGGAIPSKYLFHVLEHRFRTRAEKLTGPKVIFVGGSNLIFGMRTEELGRRIGRPVANYGLCAFIGLDLIAARAAEVVRPGDWVVVAPEALHFFLPQQPNHDRIDFQEPWRPTDNDPWWSDIWSRERARQRCTAVSTWLATPARCLMARLLQKAEKPPPPNEFDMFGPDGELIIKRPGATSKVTDTGSYFAGKDIDFQTSWGAVGFEHLREVCERRHARLAVMPAIRVADPKKDYAQTEEFERLWVDHAVKRGAAVLLRPGESTLHEKQYVFDTEWHLNDAGVRVMEERLVAALLKLFGEPPRTPAPPEKGTD